MRSFLVLAPLLLGACDNRSAEPTSPRAPNFTRTPIAGETSTRIATGTGEAVELRSGAAVPVVLPSGLAIYPGAEVVRNTTVERGGLRRTLVEFETSDPIAKVVLFHRAQALAAGAVLTLDLDGTDAASIGGRTAAGQEFAITAQRGGGRTAVQLSVGGQQ